MASKIAFLTTDNRENFRRYELVQPYFGTAPEALLQGFAVGSDVEVHVVSCTQHPMKSPEKIADNIWFHSLLVPKIGWLRTGYQGCIRATRKFLRELQPDIVHGQGTERDCAISAVFSGFPNLITIHGNMRLIAKVNRAKPFSYMWLAARIEHFTIPRTDGVVCISRYTQQAVSNLALKTWVLPNAVSQSFFEIESAPQDGFIILCVGHISLRKNQNAFIRALDPLASKMRDLKVMFLGYASERDPYCAEFFELIKLRPWCDYAGYAGGDTVRKRLATAQLLALPSLEENCPMVLLEAMAAGLPVVAARVGGVPELIENNVTGILCDPTNADSMRNAVAEAITNPELAKAISGAARRVAIERFHPDRIARKHIEIYQELSSTSS
jgi:glycosyltransferase involved in cell wall biosynthesis